MELDPRSRDLVVRTVLGEAANEPDDGMAGVAAVIRNRAQAGRYGGDNPVGVVTARNQFEPWNTQSGRTRMFSYSPDSPAYQRAAAAVDGVFGGQIADPTNGATHFYSPSAQAALGRNAPTWAQGEGQAIGRHTFYAPEGRVNTDISAAQRQPNPVTDEGILARFAQSQTPQEPKPVNDQGVLARFQASQQPAFNDRFQPMQAPQNAQPLQAGLENKAAELTSGPKLDQTAQMAIEQHNLLSGAQQGTSPHADQYKGKLVSADTFESDSGDVMYRDPSTGQVVPTDKSKQVALRDPADGKIKIFDRSTETNEGSLTGAARVLAPGLAAGAVTARPAIATASKEIVPKASEIFASAKPYYKEFTQAASKIEVPAQTAADFSTRIKGSLEKANFIPELAQPVYKAVEILEKGEPLTLDAMQNIKRVVGRSFQSPDKNVRDAAAVASREIGKIMGEVSPAASQSLKTADEIHSTARSVQDLQRKSDVADLRAGRAGYGGNAVNSMRQVLSPIVQRSVEGKMTGFKPDELAAMREIVEGTPTTNVLRGLGQLSPSKGIMQTGGAGAAAYAMGPVVGAAIPALGAASNKLATFLTGKQIDSLKGLVAKRSPAYAEAVGKATEKFERAQMELVNDPAPNRFAAYLSASRALASGLNRDGIQISAGDLIRQLQGPMKSAASDEQPEAPRGINQ